MLYEGTYQLHSGVIYYAPISDLYSSLRTEITILNLLDVTQYMFINNQMIDNGKIHVLRT